LTHSQLTHKLNPAWFQPLNLSSEKLISKFAFFKCNLYRYTQVASLERRLLAMSRAAASAAGPACNAALNNAMDARKHAESHAAALEVELDAARNLTDAVTDTDGRHAASTLRTSSDRHRRLLSKERGAGTAALESCKAHAVRLYKLNAVNP
jgi:hypothetical protein